MPQILNDEIRVMTLEEIEKQLRCKIMLVTINPFRREKKQIKSMFKKS